MSDMYACIPVRHTGNPAYTTVFRQSAACHAAHMRLHHACDTLYMPPSHHAAPPPPLEERACLVMQSNDALTATGCCKSSSRPWDLQVAGTFGKLLLRQLRSKQGSVCTQSQSVCTQSVCLSVCTQSQSVCTQSVCLSVCLSARSLSLHASVRLWICSTASGECGSTQAVHRKRLAARG